MLETAQKWFEIIIDLAKKTYNHFFLDGLMKNKDKNTTK